MPRTILLFCLWMYPVFLCAQQPPAANPAPLSQQGTNAAAPEKNSANPSAKSSVVPPAVKPLSNAGLQAAAWAVLQQGTASDKARDRSDALVALSALDRNARAISSIQAAVDDKDAIIRLLAVTSLGDMKARPAVPRLRAALDDDSPQISFAAAEALWKMGDRSGRDILYEVLNGERKIKPGLVKGNLEKAKQQMHDPKALMLIGVNQASGAFLGPFSMGISFLEEYAKHNTAPVQSLCAQLLAEDDDVQTVKELRDALADNNWSVRAAAARAFAKSYHPEVIPQLRDVMDNDKEPAPRFAAAAAIVRLTDLPVKRAVATPSPSSPNPLAQPQK